MIIKRLLLALVIAVACSAQTQITDTLYSADGSPFVGTLKISWPPFTTAAGQAVGAGNETIAITSGVVNMLLWPTEDAGPATSYTVSTFVGGLLVATEHWQVPINASPVTLAVVRAAIYSPGTGLTATAVGNLFSGSTPCFLSKDGACSVAESPLTFGFPLVRTSNAITIAQAGFGNGGYLSSGDYSTFSAKAGSSACPTNQVATQTVTSGVICSPITVGMLPGSVALTTLSYTDPSWLTFSTKALGTPSAINLANATNLPASALPNPSASTLGGVESKAAVSHQFLTSISTSGVPTSAQPASSDLSDSANVALLSALAASATTDTTNAGNISSGVLAVARGGRGTGTVFTQGSIVFTGASGVEAQDNSNLFWDATNHRQLIGTPTVAGGQIDIKSTGTSFGASGVRLEESSTSNYWDTAAAFGNFYLGYKGTTVFQLGNTGSLALGSGLNITLNPAGLSYFNASAGNFLNGGTTDGGFRSDIQKSGSSGTFRCYDQTPSTGATSCVVRAGPGDASTAKIFSVQSNSGTPLHYATADGNTWIVPQASLTGQRYVCIDTTGKLVSSASACSGT